MKKYLLSFSVIVLFAIYVLFGMPKSSSVIQAPVVIQGELLQSHLSPLAAPQPTPAPVPVPVPVPRIAYNDGEYTGGITEALYGDVQVKAIIQDGKITDVVFLSYPNERLNSMRINGHAMPTLISEAIQSQKAAVDIVSGATVTSEGFIESLSSALSQAKK